MQNDISLEPMNATGHRIHFFAISVHFKVRTGPGTESITVKLQQATAATTASNFDLTNMVPLFAMILENQRAFTGCTIHSIRIAGCKINVQYTKL